MERAAREYEALISEYYQVWFRFHPVEALEAGVSGYEGGLPAVDDDDVGALAAWLEATVVGLEELDFRALDHDSQLDVELLFGACQDEHQMLLKRDWRHRDPLGFLPFRSIRQLVHSPAVAHKGALEGCIGSLPEYLRHARSQLSSFPQLIPRVWLDFALEQASAGVGYLDQLGDTPPVSSICPDHERVAELCDSASQAVAGYRDFLQEIAPQAQGSVGCGQERFQARLRLRHALSGEIEGMLGIAREIFDQTRAELQQLCLENCGNSDLDSWLARLVGGQPLGSGELLQFARARSGEMRAFLQEKKLVEIPAETELSIEVPPDSLSPDLHSATYLPPVAGDPSASGILLLDLEGQGPHARLAAGVLGQCLRNGWPGRHLQAVCGAISRPAGSLVRRLNPSSTMTGGWALYTEQLMHEQGYAIDPEQSLIRLLERLRRSLLAILDVEIHVQGRAPSEALQQLMALPGVSSSVAEFDLLNLTRNPSEQLAGLLGWQLITLLREQQQGEGGFELSNFHGRLLQQGPVAAPLLMRRLFGADAWRGVAGLVGLAP